MKRGEIYRVNLNPTVGHEQQGEARPSLIFSIDIFNENTSGVMIIPLTSSPRALFPLIIPLPSLKNGNTSALCGQLRAIDKSRIYPKFFGVLNDEDMKEVEKAVKQILGL